MKKITNLEKLLKEIDNEENIKIHNKNEKVKGGKDYAELGY